MADTAVNPDADGLVGSVTIWPSNVLPSTKYLFAEGQAISRTDYSLLFSRFGELHGVGDGSTTFNIPDYRKRFIAGFDASDSGYDTVGESGGSATGAVSGTTGSDGAHDHDYSGTTSTENATTARPLTPADDLVAESGHTHTFSGTTTSDGAHTHSFSGAADTVPPYKVARYIVKVL